MRGAKRKVTKALILERKLLSIRIVRITRRSIGVKAR
tara:strand:+ start:2201 stop:2311 length:111 start_codon:yes stop_codon:yes gene_type:complete